jgi:SSS family solute:Na+ symporter
MTMVTHLFPTGIIGLIICALVAVLVATIGSSLNALSTVFTNDIYLQKIRRDATVAQQVSTGRITVAAGCVLAVLMAIALDHVKGQSLFYIFQSILSFLAPPLSVVFLLAVFWKRVTRNAVNAILSWGSAFSLGVGLVYLWILPKDGNPYFKWPNPFLISFYIFLVLMLAAVVISLVTKDTGRDVGSNELPVTSRRVKWLFAILGLVIISFYFVFNGH